MERRVFSERRLAPSREDQVWELYHENSKTSRWDVVPGNDDVRQRMADLWEALPYDGYPFTALPPPMTADSPGLFSALLSRESSRSLKPRRLSLEELATLLHCSYGVTRSNEGTYWPRPFRAAPSAGAMYPLELYFHSTQVDGLKAGLYHYDPTENGVRRLIDGDMSRSLGEALVQSNLAFDSSAIFFLTAVFERSVFKYGNRGYRFVLLEAGHVAQNLNLTALGIGLGALNIGGYVDRRIDEMLGLDGVTHSTVYMLAVGEAVPETGPPTQAL